MQLTEWANGDLAEVVMIIMKDIIKFRMMVINMMKTLNDNDEDGDAKRA